MALLNKMLQTLRRHVLAQDVATSIYTSSEEIDLSCLHWRATSKSPALGSLFIRAAVCNCMSTAVNSVSFQGENLTSRDGET